jgi:hypothetical protein
MKLLLEVDEIEEAVRYWYINAENTGLKRAENVIVYCPRTDEIVAEIELEE